jgi:acetyl esterase/lipase
MPRRVAVFVLTLFSVSSFAQPGSRVDANVVYGMYSGLALLMDVHRPEKPNGYGVIFVSGSAWQAPMTYGATGLKHEQIEIWGPPLLGAGYTVFAINHRAAPRFHYPAPVEDVQRAVRFVRHHAARFGIDSSRLGGVAGSSGAHLVSLVALLAAPGNPDDPDPVQREPATLQAVVARAAPTDLRVFAAGPVVSLMERLPDRTPEDKKIYALASPITHVSASAPPMLLLHGDSDDLVPVQQSIAMEAALRKAGANARLVVVPGGEHGPDFGVDGKAHPQLPQLFGQAVGWLDEHLKASKPR